MTRGSSVDYSGKRDRLSRMASRMSTDGPAAGAGINAARREPKEAGVQVLKVVVPDLIEFSMPNFFGH